MFDLAAFAAAHAHLCAHPAAATVGTVRELVAPAAEHYRALFAEAELTPPGYVNDSFTVKLFPDDYNVRLPLADRFEIVRLAFLTDLVRSANRRDGRVCRFVVCHHAQTLPGDNYHRYDVRPLVPAAAAADDPTDPDTRAAVAALPDLFVKLDLHLVRTGL